MKIAYTDFYFCTRCFDLLTKPESIGVGNRFDGTLLLGVLFM